MIRATHATRAIDVNGTGRDGYTEGNPGTLAATVITAVALNGVQEEIVRAVEIAGLTPSTSKEQLSLTIEVQRVFDRAHALAAATGTFAAPTAVATWSSSSRAVPGSPPGAAQHLSPAWAGVKTNTFLINGTSVGSVTAALTAVAFKHGSTRVAVAVGSDGKWARDSEGTLTTGTISGTPDLRQLAWDQTNSLWWAVGPGGIRKSADGALSWTSVSATQHDSVLPLPSGRVLFWRPGDTKIYYTDDLSTLVAGATVAGFSTPVWDPSNGLATAIAGANIVQSPNGASVSVSAADFRGAWSGLFLFKCRGRVYLELNDNGSNEGIAIAAYVSEKLSVVLADWVRLPLPYGASSPGVPAGGGEMLVFPDSGGIRVTQPIIDLTGSLS